jgi:menaquinone-dependent protoporphyrinogen oxidase
MKMDTLIVYATKHGFTSKCSVILKERLGNRCELHLLKGHEFPDPIDYQTILIGGSIHAGQIQKVIREFCRFHKDILLARKVGLFLSCMEKGEKALEEFNAAYPDWLRDHAKAKAVLGGAFYFDKMSLFERVIIRKVTGVNETVERLDSEKIEKFLAELLAD